MKIDSVLKMSKIDYNAARAVFENYLNSYDRKNDKVWLKIVHTYGVVAESTELAKRLHLGEEDTSLARIIALLHDIGRFEQLKRFDSFEPDTMDHAAFGVHLLFEEGKIRDFIKEPAWDSIIRTAIARHSDFKLEGISDQRELLHARLIRDADKLDNCRVKLEDSIETMLGVSPKEVGRSSITPEVMAQFMDHKSIYSPTRKTKMDYWLSYLAYFFDINFRATLTIIEERQYISRLIARIPYSDPKTAAQMQEVKKILQDYFSSRTEDPSKAADTLFA